MSTKRNSYRDRKQSGLTLLELLLVVFILSSIALVTVSIVDNADEQLRYEDTRTRLKQIKKGIIGDPSITVNNQPLISGFVADMGVLPTSMQELIERGPTIDGLFLPEWQFLLFDPANNSRYGFWAGWRGPYVEPLLEKKDDAPSNILSFFTYRDGWDNPIEYQKQDLYGWKSFYTHGDSLIIQSYGSDGPNGKEYGSDYINDYPPRPVEALHPPALIEKQDYLIDVRPLTLTAKIINSATEFNLHLKLFYPELDDDKELILKHVVSNTRSIGETNRYQFDFYDVKDPIPWGVQYIVLYYEEGDRILFDVMPPLEIRLIPRAALPSLPEQEWTFSAPPSQPGQLQEPP